MAYDSGRLDVETSSCCDKNFDKTSKMTSQAIQATAEC